MSKPKNPFQSINVAAPSPDGKESCLVPHIVTLNPAQEVVKAFVEALHKAESDQRERCNKLAIRINTLGADEFLYTLAVNQRIGITSIVDLKEFKALEELLYE